MQVSSRGGVIKPETINNVERQDRLSVERNVDVNVKGLDVLLGPLASDDGS